MVVVAQVVVVVVAAAAAAVAVDVVGVIEKKEGENDKVAEHQQDPSSSNIDLKQRRKLWIRVR